MPGFMIERSQIAGIPITPPATSVLPRLWLFSQGFKRSECTPQRRSQKSQQVDILTSYVT